MDSFHTTTSESSQIKRLLCLAILCKLFTSKTIINIKLWPEEQVTHLSCTQTLFNIPGFWGISLFLKSQTAGLKERCLVFLTVQGSQLCHLKELLKLHWWKKSNYFRLNHQRAKILKQSKFWGVLFLFVFLNWEKMFILDPKCLPPLCNEITQRYK